MKTELMWRLTKAVLEAKSGLHLFIHWQVHAPPLVHRVIPASCQHFCHRSHLCRHSHCRDKFRCGFSLFTEIKKPYLLRPVLQLLGGKQALSESRYNAPWLALQLRCDLSEWFSLPCIYKHLNCETVNILVTCCQEYRHRINLSLFDVWTENKFALVLCVERSTIAFVLSRQRINLPLVRKQGVNLFCLPCRQIINLPVVCGQRTDIYLAWAKNMLFFGVGKKNLPLFDA